MIALRHHHLFIDTWDLLHLVLDCWRFCPIFYLPSIPVIRFPDLFAAFDTVLITTSLSTTRTSTSDAMQARPYTSCGACPFVCLSVTFVHSVKTNKHIFKFFLQSGSHTILVIRTKRHSNIQTGTPLTGGVECRWGRLKSRFSTNIWLCDW